MAPWDSADMCFCSRQSDTILYCEVSHTGLVYYSLCLFTPQLLLVLIAEGWPG